MKRPGVHFAQELLLTNVPGLQMPQVPGDAPPQLPREPLSQILQLLHLLCPGDSWNVDDAHSEQLDALSAEIEPAGHGEHAVSPSRG